NPIALRARAGHLPRAMDARTPKLTPKPTPKTPAKAGKTTKPKILGAKTAGTKAQAGVKTSHAPLTHPEIKAIVVGIMLAMFLGALDQTIVATALPTIGWHFRALDNISWVVTAYLLTATAVTPLYGKLSDIHGRRVMMLIAIGLFVAGSVACAM